MMLHRDFTWAETPTSGFIENLPADISQTRGTWRAAVAMPTASLANYDKVLLETPPSTWRRIRKRRVLTPDALKSLSDSFGDGTPYLEPAHLVVDEPGKGPRWYARP
jgi:hypothetical protein